MKTEALVLKAGRDIDWHLFETSLHDRFGVNAVTLDKNGDRMTSGDLAWANGLCALIKASPNGATEICTRLLEILRHAVKARRTCAMDECFAGMNKIVFPIIRDEEINGFVNICGRPFCNCERIYTDFIRKTIDADAEEIRRRLPSVNPIGPRTLKEVKRYVTTYPQ